MIFHPQPLRVVSFDPKFSAVYFVITVACHVILRSVLFRLAMCYTMIALEAGRLGSILSLVKPKTLKLVSAVTLAKRSAIKCSAEDQINRE